MPEKVYEGRRIGDGTNTTVTVNGKLLFNYGPHSDGLEWGYSGAGPSALAYSMLCDYYGAYPDNSLRLYKERTYWQLAGPLSEEVTSQFPRRGFTYTSEELGKWIMSKELAKAPSNRG